MPSELTFAERAAARTVALADDCLRVDELGVATGHIDADDPDYRETRDVTLQMRREAQQRLRTYRRTRRALPTAVATVRRIAATPRPRAARSRGGQRSRSPGRLADDPDSEPELDTDWRGFLAASVRMVQRCERRRAKAAAA